MLVPGDSPGLEEVTHEHQGAGELGSWYPWLSGWQHLEVLTRLLGAFAHAMSAL